MSTRACLRCLLSLVILLGLLSSAIPVSSQSATQQDTISPAPHSLFLPNVTNQAEVVPVIPDTTEVMSSATTEHLETLSAEGTFTFDRLTPELAELDPGDVMVGSVSPAAPYGFLRKVKSITQQDGAFVVATEPAALEEAIENGSIHLREQLTPDMVLAASYADGVTLVASPDDPLLYFEFDDTVLYDMDKDESTTGDQIKASGSISVELATELDYEIEGFEAKRVEFAFDIEEEVNLSVGWEVKYELAKSIPFADLKFNTIIVTVGIVPVVITPEVTLALDMNGSVGAAVAVSVSQHAALKAGARTATASGARSGRSAIRSILICRQISRRARRSKPR